LAAAQENCGESIALAVASPGKTEAVMNQRQAGAPEESPGVASAEQGVVLLDGPDGVAISMTPEAAEATARSLLDAAREAGKQRDLSVGHRPLSSPR